MEAQSEFNICGVFVQTTPARLDEVENALANTPGVDIHQIEEDGRMVVTVEDTPDKYASQTLSELRLVEGVLSASLVYHHCDTESQMSEDIIS